VLFGGARVAQAHTAEQGFVLTLPTDLYVLGGTLVVALSFVLVTLVPRLAAWPLATIALGRPPRVVTAALGLAALVATAALVVVGITGTQDPTANLLPLMVWTVGWIGFTALSLVVGDLWTVIRPWPAWRTGARFPPLDYPAWLGAWPAFVGLAAFAWFELIHTTPANPTLLAWVVTAYVLGTALAVALFGAAWLRHGETFSVYFRMVSWLAPIGRRAGDDDAFELRLPGTALVRDAAPTPGLTAFVLLALATVSFDGLSRTFWWLGVIGVNPLDFPGRSAVASANTVGLVGMLAALAVAFALATWLGRRLGGGPASAAALVPIALGYHLAHYLPVALIDGQYAWFALTAALGMGDGHGAIRGSLLSDYRSVRLIWHVQVAIIVPAHVAAVAVGHARAARDAATTAAPLRGQLPLTALMIVYTLFGLWLLSTPTIG
jgi:hypothetical protein